MAAAIFQSSPPPKERCNTRQVDRKGSFYLTFQSSPPPKERCNLRDGLLGIEVGNFQSSPPPKERCNVAGGLGVEGPELLSILTAPEGAVQCRLTIWAATVTAFQSSPPPKERCNMQRKLREKTRERLSILTAPEGAVQFFSTHAFVSHIDPFNPHRPRRSGAILFIGTD